MVGSPVLFVAIPLLAAFLIPLMGMIWKEFVRIIPGLVLAYMLVLSVSLMIYVQTHGTIVEVISGWGPPVGINLVFSPFSGFLTTLMTFLGLLVWLYSHKYKRNVDYEPAKKYFILLMLMVTGSVGIVLTGDLFNMFVFIEIVSISGYGLTSFFVRRDSAEAAFKFLFMGALASSFLLIGIMIIYTQLGTLNIAEIAQRMPQMDYNMKVFSLIFLLVAIGVEAELFPLNGWAPDVYTQAPGPISAAMSGIVVKAAIYANIRIIFTMYDLQGAYQYLLVVGLITFIVAETAALKQERLKRMLAYSSIGQMGLAMIAFGIGTKEGVYAALFLMFSHAIIKSLLFFSGSYLVFNKTSKYIKHVNGMGKYLPVTAFLFTLGAFAIIGLPPFMGFWSKLALLSAAADSNLVILVAVILAVSVVEAVYYLRVVNRIFFFKKKSNTKPEKPTINAMIAMLSLAAIVLVIGFYPDLVTGLIERAADDLMDKGHYIGEILSKK